MAAEQRQRIVGLDVGTSKAAAVVAEVTPAGELELAGIGTHPCNGLKRGVVVNIESTVQAIGRAVEEAELMAGGTIDAVYAGIAGGHVRSLNSDGSAAIRDGEVCQQDVDRAIDAAKAVAIPADQRLLHILPQEYVVDAQDGVREPLGMSGVRLEAKVHMVACADNAMQNIEKCIKRCGLAANDIILEQLASSYATLADDERDLGVCLLDIGGGTTDIAVFADGAVRHTAVIPIAGDQVTSDIAMALRTPIKHAEAIKVRHGCALTQLAKPEETIQVPGTAQRPSRELSRQALAEVIEPRYEELFTLVQAELRRSGLEEMIAAGLVLTGGAAKMEGLVELAEEIFHMPVCVGTPRHVLGLTEAARNPIYATGIGLALYGLEQEAQERRRRGRVLGGGWRPRLDAAAGTVQAVRRWLQDKM